MLQDITARRRAYAETIGDDGALLLFTAPERPRSNDTLYRYRPDSDFLYLTNFDEPEAILLLLPGHTDHEFTLFVRPRDRDREIWDGFRYGPEGARRQFGADAAYEIAAFEERFVELVRDRRVLHYALGEDSERDRRILTLLDKLAPSGRAAARGPDTIVDPRRAIHAMRRIKSREEIDRIAAAAEVSAYAHRAAMRAVRPGVMEYEVQAILEAEMRRLGAEGPSYASIVAGGANACVLHYISNRETLRDGDLVLIDAGAEVNWYAGDITRTFPVGERFSPAQRELYEAVLAVEEDAIDRVRPGVSWQEHHRETRRQLAEAMVALGLLRGSVTELVAEDRDRAFFMHGTGHYLGMDVHDVGPYARWNYATGEQEDLPFEDGVVLTIEPGIYVSPDAEDVPERFRGLGVRIEDNVAIVEGSPVVLTDKAPKTVDDLETVRAVAFGASGH